MGFFLLSINATKWGWSVRGLKPHLRLTLLAIADACDADGYGYPGQERIAEMLECSARQIRKNINELINLGHIEVVRRGKKAGGGGRTSNGYQLRLEEPQGSDKSGGVTGTVAQGYRNSEVGLEEPWGSYERFNGIELEEKNAPKKNAKRPARRISDDWEPGEKAVAWIESHGVNIKQAKPAIIEFREYWRTRKTKRGNWDLAFMRNGKVESVLLRIKGNGNATHNRSNENSIDRANRVADEYFSRSNQPSSQSNDDDIRGVVYVQGSNQEGS